MKEKEKSQRVWLGYGDGMRDWDQCLVVLPLSASIVIALYEIATKSQLYSLDNSY